MVSLAGCATSSVGEAVRPTTPAAPVAGSPAPLRATGPVSPEAVTALVNTNTPGAAGYQIGPLDVLDITVFKVPELSKTVQVSESGRFGYPLVGDVQAAGRSPRDVERDLTRLLGDKYLRSPQVSILVKEYNSQRFTVEGAVKKPGVFPMQGQVTLMQAVAGAQGLEPLSDDTLVIFRQINGQRSIARFSMSDLRAGKIGDPTLVPGDIVMAPSSDVKEGMMTLFKAAPLIGVFALL